MSVPIIFPLSPGYMDRKIWRRAYKLFLAKVGDPVEWVIADRWAWYEMAKRERDQSTPDKSK